MEATYDDKVLNLLIQALALCPEDHRAAEDIDMALNAYFLTEDPGNWPALGAYIESELKRIKSKEARKMHGYYIGKTFVVTS